MRSFPITPQRVVEQCPCKGCKKRRLYCHGGNKKLGIEPCKAYAEWSEANTKYNEYARYNEYMDRIGKLKKPPRERKPK